MTINLNPQGRDETIQSAQMLLGIVDTQVIPALRANPLEPSNLDTGVRFVQELKAIDQKLKGFHVKPILKDAIQRLNSELEHQSAQVRNDPYRLARYYEYEIEEASSQEELTFLIELVERAIENTPQMDRGVFNITKKAIQKKQSELNA